MADFEFDVQEEERKELEARKARAMFVSDMRDIMSDSRVQKLLINLLEFSNVNGDNFTGDNNLTNYNVGRASMGTYIIGMMEEVDPTIYPRMLLKYVKEKM